ncbi:hypothetical protein SNE40_019284 [Patella caerulea]|uniref:Uncharacterized protein n=1 Tax=Patella caerulea TaxID=87958 RepID=A0AAN8J8B3_PATCE
MNNHQPLLNGEEFKFEGIFLQKVAGKVGNDKPAFVPNPTYEAEFELEDVVCKLPQRKTAGSSSRQLVFDCDLSKWQINCFQAGKCNKSGLTY